SMVLVVPCGLICSVLRCVLSCVPLCVLSFGGDGPRYGFMEKGDRVSRSPPFFDQDVPRVPPVPAVPLVSLAQPELRDDGPVALNVVGLQVVEQLLALAHQVHQRLLGAVVLLVGLQVPGE